MGQTLQLTRKKCMMKGCFEVQRNNLERDSEKDLSNVDSGEKVSAQKPLDFFTNKLLLDIEILSYFLSLILSFQRGTAQYKQFPSPLTATSLSYGGIFSVVDFQP